MNQGDYFIKEVKGRKDLKEFVNFSAIIYKFDPAWIRQPDKVTIDYLDQARNPFFKNARGQAYLLYKNKQVVARGLVTVWDRHAKLHAEKVAYFSYLECVDDKEAFASLFSALIKYAKENRCNSIKGPFNTTAAQEMGVVVKGYGEVPSADMVYTASWYPKLFEDAGFKKCLQMETWRNEDITLIDESDLIALNQIEKLQNMQITIRQARKSNLEGDLELVRELVNSSFIGNWAFVPITREEWNLQVGSLIPLLDPQLILIAEAQGIPIGVTFAAPDFNYLLKGMNGRLVHPRLLNLLNKSFFKDAVVILFAVRKQYQGLGIIKALNKALIKTLKSKKYRSLSITWISKENSSSQSQARNLKMKKLHELCMYEKEV